MTATKPITTPFNGQTTAAEVVAGIDLGRLPFRTPTFAADSEGALGVSDG